MAKRYNAQVQFAKEKLSDGEYEEILGKFEQFDEIVIRERVVPTDWEPADEDEDAPAAGTTVTRYRYNDCGEWVVEDLGE